MAANMFNQDPDDNRSYTKTVAMCVAAASLVILLFLVVLYVNSEPKSAPPAPAETVAEESEDDFLKDSHNITSDELEFWEDAGKLSRTAKNPVKEEEGELTPYRDPDSQPADESDTGSDTDKKKDKDKDDNADDEEDGSTSSTSSTSSSTSRSRRDDEDENEGSLNKNSKDDTDKDKEGYLAVTDEKGKKVYYEELEDVPKNDYDFENDLLNENGMLTYKDTKREAIKGVDLSKYNGTVDFNVLKDKDIKFVMLWLGSRGYGTGSISLDEKFVEYAQNAQLSGLQIGAYFYSQAINEMEAIEEANYIVGAVSGFSVKYPIAIDIESVSGDEARTDKLTAKERTAVVKTFCDTVKGYGYKPIIYATRDMLIAGIDLTELADYDIWLADENVPTDYPYRFTMWQYNKKGKIDGISGDIDLNLCFINYEQK